MKRILFSNEMEVVTDGIKPKHSTDIEFTNIEKLADDKKKRFTPDEVKIENFLTTDITNSTSTISFGSLMEYLNEGTFILPKYQRKYVWSHKAVNLLVTSLIRGIPIPSLYIYPNGKGQYIILDGQQRCISLFLYWCDLYTRDFSELDFYGVMKRMGEGFSLREILQQNFVGKDKPFGQIEDGKKRYGTSDINLAFGSLHPKLQKIIEGCNLSFCKIVVDNEDKEKEKALYADIFRLLNSTGYSLTPQEIRNGSFICEFYDTIYELVDLFYRYSFWSRMFEKRVGRAKDMERILRMISLEHYTEIKDGCIIFKTDKFGKSVFKTNMNKLIDEFSAESVSFTENKVWDIRQHALDFVVKLDKLNHEPMPWSIFEALYNVYVKTEDDRILEPNFLEDIKEDYLKSSSVLEENIQSKEFGDTLSRCSHERPKLEQKFTYVYKCYLKYRDKYGVYGRC